MVHTAVQRNTGVDEIQGACIGKMLCVRCDVGERTKYIQCVTTDRCVTPAGASWCMKLKLIPKVLDRCTADGTNIEDDTAVGTKRNLYLAPTAHRETGLDTQQWTELFNRSLVGQGRAGCH